MKEEDAVDQKEIKRVGSSIYVGDNQYVKAVIPPDPSKLLQLPLVEINRILAAELLPGPRLEYKSNFFTAYSADVNNHKQISDMYYKLRLNHADARHIVCAWNVPALLKIDGVDSCDDEDYGAGVAILKVLIDLRITHKVIFIVRKCGEKLSQDRIPCYTQIANAIFANNPVNRITGLPQA